MPTAVEIKKALKEAGVEIYRTRGDVVYLADRVRENLLMDAGTFIRGNGAATIARTSPGDDGGSAPKPLANDGGSAPKPLAVGFVVRAQRTDFPNDGEEHLFQRARG